MELYRSFRDIYGPYNHRGFMTEYVYEKDLRQMKYRILVSKIQDEAVTKIAECLDINKQDLRKYLIENIDMSFLENIPARYNSWLSLNKDKKDDLSSLLYVGLLTDHIPFLKKEDMEKICKSVEEEIKSGISREDAIKKGRKNIREMIFK